MLVFHRCVAIACLVSGSSPFAPRRLEAQAVDYLKPLAVPPRSAGTCMPTEVRRLGVSVPWTISKLVMVSLPPGSRREITVTVDGAGRAVGYSELTFASNSLRSSKGDHVVATIEGNGRVRGWQLMTNTVLPDSVPLGITPAAQRSMREQMTTTSSRDTLTAGAQRQVLELVEWLRHRCPA